VAQLTLVLGGVRSGKSRFAEQIAAAHPPVTYVATAQAGDAEMAERIARHRRLREQRTPDWQTVEEAWAVPRAVAVHGTAGCVLVECLTLWLTNLVVGLPGHPERDDAAVLAEVGALVAAAQSAAGRVVIVSHETGCGILPANAMARRFGDLLGEANQRLAAAATEVYVSVAGIPLRIK
jgi:adenosylcobinamide kinase/adenosylcobinamide-phosphate guanylyltransferase